MPTVEAVYLSGVSILLEDCETVGDVMTKIAMSRGRFATHIVVIDPGSGRQMLFDENIQIQKVEFGILTEEAVDCNDYKLNLRLHADQSDCATCSSIFDRLRMLAPGYFVEMAGDALRDALFSRERTWISATRTLLGIGVSGNSALLQAIEVGRADVVQFLVDGEMNSEPGWVPCLSDAMLDACKTEHTQVVKVLLDAGAKVNSQREDDDAPLFVASGGGRTEIVRMLLDAGSDVNSMGRNGTKALTRASFQGETETVRMLLNAGADVTSKNGNTALIAGLSSGTTEIARMLLDARADPNGGGFGEFTALMRATTNSDTEQVQMLLDAGADIESKRTDFGYTALALAAAIDAVQVVPILVDAGADVNSKDNSGRTVLDIASDRAMSREGSQAGSAWDRGLITIMRILVAAGAEEECRNEALIAASSRGQVQIVRMLLDAEVDVNGKRKHGCTALIAAAYEGRTETVRMLLDAEADVNNETEDGNSALTGAVSSGYPEVVRMLRDAGAAGEIFLG